MYSPRIDSRFVPLLYHAAKARKIPMTTLVNEVIADYLAHQADADANLAPISLPRASGCDDARSAASADRSDRSPGGQVTRGMGG
jgi:hypothetical protein